MNGSGVVQRLRIGILIIAMSASAVAAFSSFVPVADAFAGINPEIGPNADNGSTGTAGGGSRPATAQPPDGIAGFIYTLCIGIGGWLLWFGGTLLDWTIKMLVIEMGKLVGPSGFGPAIETMWVIIRDIFNILFIFGLIYIGFKTIWNASDSSTRKALGMLIAAALLINFSLYFTRVIVDFSNLAAYQIYNLIQVRDPNATPGSPPSLASAFLEKINLETYANQNQGFMADSAGDSGDLADMRVVGYAFLMMLFMLVTAFVFAAGAIFLVIRFVALILFMIFSPVLLLGWVLPFMAGESKKRFHQLISYAFVAPAFLFMIYLSLTVLQTINSTDTFAAAFNPRNQAGAFQLIVYFFLVVGLMFASLLVARQMGVAGATQAVNIANAAQKKARIYAARAAGKTAFGTTAAVMRNTIGASAAKYAESRMGQRMMRRGGAAGLVGRKLMLGADNLRHASFDARQVGGMGKKLGLGEGKKGGFAQRQKDIDAREQRLAKLAGSEDERFYADAGVSDIHEWRQDLLQQRETARADLANTSNEEDRRRLTAAVNALETEIANLENNKFSEQPPESFSGTPEQWREELGRLREYNRVRGDMKARIQNEYAANLQRRGENLHPAAKGFYRLFMRSASENKDAADSIRKEVSKSQQDKLIDAIKGINSGSKEG